MSERLAGDPAEILLVEDNLGDIRLTQEAFKEGEIRNTLHVVTDGVAVMDFLYQQGDHVDAARPDIVLLDLNLPMKNGEDVPVKFAEESDIGVAVTKWTSDIEEVNYRECRECYEDTSFCVVSDGPETCVWEAHNDEALPSSEWPELPLNDALSLES